MILENVNRIKSKGSDYRIQKIRSVILNKENSGKKKTKGRLNNIGHEKANRKWEIWIEYRNVLRFQN